MPKLKTYCAINGQGESVLVWATDKKDAFVRAKRYFAPYKVFRFKPIKTGGKNGTI